MSRFMNFFLWFGCQLWRRLRAGATAADVPGLSAFSVILLLTSICFATTPTGPLAYSGLTPLSGTLFFPTAGGALPSGAEAQSATPAPITGPVQNFYVKLSIPPGAGNSISFTWRDNAISQAVTCTIAGAVATACNDLTHSFTATQGDQLDIQAVSTGAIPGVVRVIMSSQYGSAVPAVSDIQQSLLILCYDTNDMHTVSFACSRNPSGTPLTTGSVILFRFAATTNGANPCIDVESSGCAQISLSNGSAIPSASLAGDDSGTENTYLLTFDADDDLWIFANQLLH